MTAPTRCPCGSGDTYPQCCGRFHSGAGIAATATALMRSRFSAFVIADENYLLATWHPSTRPDVVELDHDLRWTQLEIIEAVRGGPFDTTGIVEFRAHFRTSHGRGVLRERSTFERTDSLWYYVSGELK